MTYVDARYVNIRYYMTTVLVQYGTSFVESFPCNCSKCRGVVIPLCQQETMPNEVKLRLWMDHTSKCGGSDDNHKAHNELNSLIIKAVLTSSEPAGPLFKEKDIRTEQRGHRPDDETAPADFEHNDPAHPGHQLIMGDPACVSAVCDTYLARRGSARSVGYAAAQEEWNKFNRNENSSLDVRQRGDRLIPLVMTEHGAMGAHFKAYLNELATLAVNRPGGIPAMMRGTFAVSKYVAKAMLIRRWNARIVWGMQRQAASQIMATWRANDAFLRSCQGSCGGGSARASSASGPARPALDDGRFYKIWKSRNVMMDARTSTIWIRWIRFVMCFAVAVPFLLLVVRFCSIRPSVRDRYELSPWYCTSTVRYIVAKITIIALYIRVGCVFFLIRELRTITRTVARAERPCERSRGKRRLRYETTNTVRYDNIDVIFCTLCTAGVYVLRA